MNWHSFYCIMLRFLALRPHILTLSPTDMKLLNQESKGGEDRVRNYKQKRREEREQEEEQMKGKWSIIGAEQAEEDHEKGKRRYKRA